jgi:type II secretory ATPase GspE/PulE/Tfp pilus assembly ATPase PilB-like protein
LQLKNENIIGAKDTWAQVPFYKPNKEGDSADGYTGRIGIHEVLKVTASIKELIIKGSPQDEIEIQAKKEGMSTMLEDGILKAVQGFTSLEEVLRVVSE